MTHCAGVSVICAIVVLFTTASTKRHDGYLAVVGPPELRVTAENTNRYVFDPANFQPKVTVTATNAPVVAAAAATNSAPVEVAAPTLVTRPPEVITAVSTGQNNSGQDYNFNYPAGPASELLTVSPQMLTQYLRPDRSGSNTNNLDQPGVSVFVPAEQQFTPPAPQNAPESRAIYRSQ